MAGEKERANMTIEDVWKFFRNGSLIGLAVVATTVFTGLLYKVAKDNLEKLNETSREQTLVNSHRFLNEFSFNFFSDKTMLLFDLIEQDDGCEDEGRRGFVLVENDEVLYFNIVFDNLHEDVRTNYKDALRAVYGYDKTIFTTSEIDTLLLGNLEEIGAYRERRLIDDETMYETFAYYVQLCHRNTQLMRYIHLAREEDTQEGKGRNPKYKSDLYDNFQNIYKMCEEQERVKISRTRYKH